MPFLRWIAFLLLVVSSTLHAQQPTIYRIAYSQFNYGERVELFVSLSDIYNHNEDPDSSAIPNMEGIGIDSVRRIVLKGEYRKRFFRNTKLSETDKLFAYDYKNNKLVTLPLKSLTVMASLSIYSKSNEMPFTQYDYHLGFEINPKLISGVAEYCEYTLVSIGKTSPFITGKMKAVEWKPIPENEFAFKQLTRDDSTILAYSDEEITAYTYTYQQDGLQYYTRDFLVPEGSIARQLAVIDMKNNTRLFELFYAESEGSSPTPLNYVNPEDKMPHQWTGYLLSGKPPVILGLQYVSFGCPLIRFLSLTEKPIHINCDNRH